MSNGLVRVLYPHPKGQSFTLFVPNNQPSRIHTTSPEWLWSRTIHSPQLTQSLMERKPLDPKLIGPYLWEIWWRDSNLGREVAKALGIPMGPYLLEREMRRSRDSKSTPLSRIPLSMVGAPKISPWGPIPTFYWFDNPSVLCWNMRGWESSETHGLFYRPLFFDVPSLGAEEWHQLFSLLGKTDKE